MKEIYDIQFTNKTSIRHYLFHSIHLTHFSYSLSAQAPKHHLAIWLRLVEWSLFDSIWSILSIPLNFFTVWVLKH